MALDVPPVTVGPVSTPPVSVQTPSSGTTDPVQQIVDGVGNTVQDVTGVNPTTPVDPVLDQVGGVTGGGGSGGSKPTGGNGGGSSSSDPTGRSATVPGSTGSGSNARRPSSGDSGGSSTRARKGSRRGGSGLSAAQTRRLAAHSAALASVSQQAPAALALRTAASTSGSDSGSGGSSPIVRTVRDIVNVVPDWMKFLLAGLIALVLVLGAGSLVSTRRARRLSRQREELLEEVGLLQAALLPKVPAQLGELEMTVAYRPAEGPAAGGDFYDAFELEDGRVAIVLGDVAGHGRSALERTSLMRYTLRAYVEAGLEPRHAVQVAGRALDKELNGDFATVVVTLHDPAAGTLTWAGAGHPPPILLGPSGHKPVTAESAPPIGLGLATGMRQTTVPAPAGTVACFFTDGLVEGRIGDGLLGRDRLRELLVELSPDDPASRLLDLVAETADRVTDDMATCIVRATHRSKALPPRERLEELEVEAGELDGDGPLRFLTACGVPERVGAETVEAARTAAATSGSAVLKIRIPLERGAAPAVTVAAGEPAAVEPQAGARPVVGGAPRA
jgi:Stage II sporulation protein E (SpoIIE)